MVVVNDTYYADSAFTQQRLEELIRLAVADPNVPPFQRNRILSAFDHRGSLANMRKRIIMGRASTVLILHGAVDVMPDGDFVVTVGWSEIFKMLIEILLPLLLKLLNP